MKCNIKIDLEGNEYYFERAWSHLLSGHVIASKVTRCAYWLSEDGKSLKFYNPIVTIVQDSDYILNKEMLGMWVIGHIVE